MVLGEAQGYQNLGEERDAGRFILDISGVAQVDAEVAQHLVKVARATQLMGCDLTISGLSPDAAQTLVELGVQLGGIRTTSTLRAALEQALGPEAARRHPAGLGP